MDLNIKHLYFDTLATRLALAGDLHRLAGRTLLAAPAVRALLPVIEDYARELRHQMRETGLAEVCRRCASGPAEGCCSQEIAEEADAVLLLMNLLLGCTVAFRQPAGGGCGFLRPQDCTLMLKPIFCLNYNCGSIRTGIPAAAFRTVEKAAGRLLTAQTQLEDNILACCGKFKAGWGSD